MIQRVSQELLVSMHVESKNKIRRLSRITNGQTMVETENKLETRLKTIPSISFPIRLLQMPKRNTIGLPKKVGCFRFYRPLLCTSRCY